MADKPDSPFNGPFSNRWDDEMSTESVSHEFPQAVCTDDQPHDQHLIAGTWREHCPGRTAPAEAPSEGQDVRVTLHQTAPWNSDLTNPYRTRYATVGGRYFRVESERLGGMWHVEEITKDGAYITGVAWCFNLPAVRQAIIDLTSGMDEDEVAKRAINAPRAGTGRNHRDNVARRRAWYSAPAFDPAQVLIERHRMSVTQGEVSVTYRGRLLGRFGDELRICPRGNGQHAHDDGPVCFGGWHGHNDQHWIAAARRAVAG